MTALTIPGCAEVQFHNLHLNGNCHHTDEVTRKGLGGFCQMGSSRLSAAVSQGSDGRTGQKQPAAAGLR